MKNLNYKNELKKYKQDIELINDFYIEKEIEFLPNNVNYTKQDLINYYKNNTCSKYYSVNYFIPRDENNDIINPWRFYKRSLFNFIIGYCCFGVIFVGLLYFLIIILSSTFENHNDLVFVLLILIPAIIFAFSVLFYTGFNFYIGIKCKNKWQKILISYNITKPKHYIKK